MSHQSAFYSGAPRALLITYGNSSISDEQAQAIVLIYTGLTFMCVVIIH